MAGYGNNGGNSNKQVQPTFGVSFGLPQSSGNYPVNPYGPNPFYNPYGPAFNGGGVNLGLISVNPLLSVQVTKNDYGEKVVKPFVNLHVTPNEHVVNKLGHLFHEKKHYLLNKHEHYHHYNPYPHKPYHPHPHFDHAHGSGPHHSPIHNSHYGPPIYSPHHTFYDPALQSGLYYNKYKSQGLAPSTDDYYDDDSEYYNNESIDFNQPGYDNYYGRSANISAKNDHINYANRFGHSRSLTLPSRNPGVTRGGNSIKFPSTRKKRETDSPNSKSEYVTKVKIYFLFPS